MNGREPAKVLTIGGSDSGGAAGIQADLKTWTALRAYGMSVLTAVTAQNSYRVQDVTWLSSRFVQAQLEAVLSDYGAAAVKTGFLGKPELIIIVSALLQKYNLPNVVIDPVLVNHRHQPMFPDEVRQIYFIYLLPLADLITPNLTEAAVLLGTSTLENRQAIYRAAESLHRWGARHVLLKGFREQQEMIDIFFDGNSFTELRQPRIETENTHGSGDTLSAAICAFLAQGQEMMTAVAQAQAFTHRAIQRAVNWRLGGGHGSLSHF